MQMRGAPCALCWGVRHFNSPCVALRAALHTVAHRRCTLWSSGRGAGVCDLPSLINSAQYTHPSAPSHEARVMQTSPPGQQPRCFNRRPPEPPTRAAPQHLTCRGRAHTTAHPPPPSHPYWPTTPSGQSDAPAPYPSSDPPAPTSPPATPVSRGQPGGADFPAPTSPRGSPK